MEKRKPIPEAKALRRARRAANKTVRETARLMKVREGWVTKFEHGALGHTNPHRDRLNLVVRTTARLLKMAQGSKAAAQ